MSRPRSVKIPCPDCGGPVRFQGTREGTSIRRYLCLSEASDPDCRRRFTDNTKDVMRKDAHKAPPVTPTKDALSIDADVYIFTWAQNATGVHPGFWAALNGLRKHRNADLNVIKGRYLNRTGMIDQVPGGFNDLWWTPPILPFLWDRREDICPSIQILGDINVRPTAVNPLVGLETITGRQSGILGHPKLSMRVIPTPEGMPPKQLLTTGACTIANYTDSAAGAKGAFHHTLGATIVEVAPDGTFFMRQLNATSDGSFIDKATKYNTDGTHEPAGRALCLAMGDWHSGMTEPGVIAATFGIENYAGTMVELLRPEKITWDDLIDFYGRSHHHLIDPFKSIGKADGGAHNWDDLRAEIETACEDVDYYTKVAAEAAGGPVTSYIKADNHGEAFTRYIRERNWKSDPANATFYLETALKMAQGTKMTETGVEYPEALAVWAREWCPDAVVLNRHSSLMIADIECAYHGDIGPNGARGNIKAFSKIGVKVSIGHVHTPGIEHGAYQHGTSTRIPLGYTKGPSSWLNTHMVIYSNGKRALYTIVNGRFHHE